MSTEPIKLVNPSKNTIHTLYGLVGHKIINLTTIGIYFYIHINQNKPLSYSAISSHTGISNNHSQKHIKVLEELGLLHKVQGRKGKSNIYIIGNVTPILAKAGYALLDKPCTSRGKDLAPSHSRYINSLNLSSKSVNMMLSRILDIMYATSYSSYLDTREPKYAKDPEWIDIRKTLSQYFTDKEIDSRVLNKTYYAKLLSLHEKDDFDIAEYAKWYHDNKYSTKGFAWGLFLYDGMLDEYDHAAEGIKEVTQYLNTSSDSQKAKHSSKAKKDKARLRRIVGEIKK